MVKNKTSASTEASAKAGKYFKYAIGEIILVVIGILIALQINTWNQQRIQNKEEQSALINLKQDFEYNYRILDSILTETKENIELQFLILNHTGNKPKPKTEFEFNIINEKLTKEYFNNNPNIRQYYIDNEYLITALYNKYPNQRELIKNIIYPIKYSLAEVIEFDNLTLL